MIKAQCDGFLATPPLWEDAQFDIQQFAFPILDLSLFRPSSIPRNIRLGHQIEYVCKQLLEHSERYTLIVHNLQIRDGKRTLGEIDFILKDEMLDKYVHVELTYKFYIIDPQFNEPIHRLIGPNKRDTFFLKMEKIKNAQFPLLHSENGSETLSLYNIDHSEVEHQCCFKAQLFQPYNDNIVYDETFNEACLTGFWLKIDDFEKSDFANAQYYLPTKSEWIIEPHDDVAWKAHFEIMIEINQHLLNEFAPMVWMQKPAGKIVKLFVVWW